jgi:DNA-binding PadR family transcriptional regulator
LIEQGALYPALHRLDHQGAIASDWGVSENNRRAKYYRITPEGRRRLKEETATWELFSAAIAAALRARREEV